MNDGRMTKERLKSEMAVLVKTGNNLITKWSKGDFVNKIEGYQTWYTKSVHLIKLILPSRIEEFNSYYVSKISKKGEEASAEQLYTIQDFLIGDDPPLFYGTESEIKALAKYITVTKLKLQNSILTVAYSAIDSFLMHFDQEIYYAYQEDELAAAKTVLKVNVRAAGALCGVVIEKHLKRLLGDRVSEIKSRNPGITDLASQLKSDGKIDLPVFKRIELLGSIRNYCDHQKDRDPTEQEVKDLISGTEWLIKSVI